MQASHAPAGDREAKTYRRATAARITNSVFQRMTALGLGGSYRYVLTVHGRKTGRLYRTPVDVVDRDGSRWLVAGYGPSQWVLNERAAGEVALSRGGRSERSAVMDASPAEAVPVLRQYMRACG